MVGSVIKESTLESGGIEFVVHGIRRVLGYKARIDSNLSFVVEDLDVLFSLYVNPNIVQITCSFCDGIVIILYE